MASVNVPDSGLEVTVGDTVDTATFLVPANDWLVTNTGNKDIVVNFDGAAAPTRTQPSGASGAYMPPGASCKVPRNCYQMTYQDATNGQTSSMRISKG